jgi:hypothetical protein
MASYDSGGSATIGVRVTAPSAKADGFCLVAGARALTTAPQALRMLHPATLTPANSIQAEDHLTTRMFYASDDLSGFARFPLAPPGTFLPTVVGTPLRP